MSSPSSSVSDGVGELLPGELVARRAADVAERLGHLGAVGRARGDRGQVAEDHGVEVLGVVGAAPDVLGVGLGEELVEGRGGVALVRRLGVEALGRDGAVDEPVVVEAGELVAGRRGRDQQHGVRDRDLLGDRDHGLGRPRSREAARTVVDELLRARDGRFRVHPAVVVNQLDAVVGAVLVDRGVYLVEREVGGLLARGGGVLELAAARQQVADRQVERLRAAVSSLDPHAASPVAAAAAATASASRTSRGCPGAPQSARTLSQPWPGLRPRGPRRWESRTPAGATRRSCRPRS